jgi:hypothetical protein
MAGRSAITTVSQARSEAAAVRGGQGGVTTTETSEIGGEGRKGADGYGRLEMAPHVRIDHEAANMTHGMAKTGETGMNSAYGKTFSGIK